MSAGPPIPSLYIILYSNLKRKADYQGVVKIRVARQALACSFLGLDRDRIRTVIDELVAYKLIGEYDHERLVLNNVEVPKL